VHRRRRQTNEGGKQITEKNKTKYMVITKPIGGALNNKDKPQMLIFSTENRCFFF